MWLLRCGIRSDREELFNELADAVESGQMAAEKAKIFLMDFKNKKCIGIMDSKRKPDSTKAATLVYIFVMVLVLGCLWAGATQKCTQPLSWSLIEGAGQ